MSTTPPRFKPASLWLGLIAGVLALATAAVAQAQAKNDDQYKWPSTGSQQSQPEFEFTRSQALKDESQKIIAGRGHAIQADTSIPTVGNLLNSGVSDPFELKAPVKKQIFKPAPVLPLNIKIPKLPTLDIKEQLNLDEFKNYLDALLKNADNTSTIDLSQYDFSKELNKVIISSMMASPNAYVVINGKRFQEGDRFLLPVDIKQSNNEIEKTIQSQMPSPDAVSPQAYQKYLALRDHTLAEWRQKQANRQAQANGDLYNVSVTVEKIAHREVTVSINGRKYVLKVGMAL